MSRNKMIMRLRIIIVFCRIEKALHALDASDRHGNEEQWLPRVAGWSRVGDRFALALDLASLDKGDAAVPVRERCAWQGPWDGR